MAVSIETAQVRGLGDSRNPPELARQTKKSRTDGCDSFLNNV